MSRELTDLTTRELLKYLDWSRKFNGFYSPGADGQGYTTEEIKAVLATREHIQNKAERKRARQEEARQKRHR